MKKPRAVFRLTLKLAAVQALAKAPKRPFFFVPIGHRSDGGADVAISVSMADQLMTFAKAGENLSDTVLRVLQLQKA
jgi:hypothetical protein